ncbi:hypothetical protein ACQCN2_01060 [Brevibacillus ginsengisoli]|uniref:hypothetical protein n=1 Tax=Brevibacillus ginsengisoli TaxID=363854 RepID=UPI003CE86017
MRIFSKKSFQFDHPTGQEPAVVVLAGSFVDVPDWVSDSTMFKLASQDGDVDVIGNKKDEIAAETGSRGKVAAAKKPEEQASAESGQQQ